MNAEQQIYFEHNGHSGCRMECDLVGGAKLTPFRSYDSAADNLPVRLPGSGRNLVHDLLLELDPYRLINIT